MPCRYDPTDAEIAAAAELSKKNQRDVLNTISTLTRMLCRLCEEAFELPSDINDWYKEHLIKDEDRKKKLKKDVLAKLTDEEKEALGL